MSPGYYYPVTPAVIASQQKVADFFFKGGYIQNQIAVGDAVIAMG
ncbi:hypothetical protein PQR62_23320 [Herbaspirillum lusitanum]|uniref:Uncharacterized protein n=1 Tax=Herbaspirillum lusitanum TaxID=213312 RepID=A0ABW9AGR0_9BURK